MIEQGGIVILRCLDFNGWADGFISMGLESPGPLLRVLGLNVRYLHL